MDKMINLIYFADYLPVLTLKKVTGIWKRRLILRSHRTCQLIALKKHWRLYIWINSSSLMHYRGLNMKSLQSIRYYLTRHNKTIIVLAAKRWSWQLLPDKESTYTTMFWILWDKLVGMVRRPGDQICSIRNGGQATRLTHRTQTL